MYVHWILVLVKIIARPSWTHPRPHSLIFLRMKGKVRKRFFKSHRQETKRSWEIKQKMKDDIKSQLTKIINNKILNKSNAVVLSGHYRQTWEIKGLRKGVPVSPGVGTQPGKVIGNAKPQLGQEELGALPHCHPAPHSSPLELKATRAFPRPRRVRQTWEARQELLRDPGRHKRLLPQRALSSGLCGH